MNRNRISIFVSNNYEKQIIKTIMVLHCFARVVLFLLIVFIMFLKYLFLLHFFLIAIKLNPAPKLFMYELSVYCVYE